MSSPTKLVEFEKPFHLSDETGIVSEAELANALEKMFGRLRNLAQTYRTLIIRSGHSLGLDSAFFYNKRLPRFDAQITPPLESEIEDVIRGVVIHLQHEIDPEKYKDNALFFYELPMLFFGAVTTTEGLAAGIYSLLHTNESMAINIILTLILMAATMLVGLLLSISANSTLNPTYTRAGRIADQLAKELASRLKTGEPLPDTFLHDAEKIINSEFPDAN